jgi:hypothetical protein
MATRWKTEESVFDLWRGQMFFIAITPVDPNSFYAVGDIAGGGGALGCLLTNLKLTSHIHMVSRLSMCGVVPPHILVAWDSVVAIL